VQVRTQDVSVNHLNKLVLATVKKYKDDLESGALIVLDESKGRVRILPLN